MCDVLIIRNITFQDTTDCFPQWAPTDGALGSWNSLYDAISLRDANNIWIDHNTFEDRTTRDETLPLAFGVLFQVHLYNNLYNVRGANRYQYSLGVGVESQIYAEENVFLTDRTLPPDRFLGRFGGTALTTSGTRVIGARVRNPVDLVAAYNEVNDPDLGFNAGWVPTLNVELLPAFTTPLLVPLLAGPLDW